MKEVGNNMAYNEISVLIFGSGGRQALPMSKGFFDLGCNVTAYCESKLDTGYLTKYKHNKILFDKRNTFGESFFEYGIRLIKSGRYDLVIPMSDSGAEFLSENKKHLSKYAKIAVNDWDKFRNVIDKNQTMKFCQENGIPAPKTIISDDPLLDFNEAELCYPLVVKPRTACGSIGFNIVYNRQTLENVFTENSQGPLLIQEYIPKEGGQFEAEIFIDKQGIIRSCVVSKAERIFPLDGGSPVLSKSIMIDEIKESAGRLAKTLNWIGYLDIDLIYDIRDCKYKVIEANPRIGADVKLDYISGVNIAKLIIENEFYENVSDMTDYTEGKFVVCGVTDVLWFIKNKNRFNSKPSWFMRRGFVDAVFDLKDIKPFVGFCIQHIFNYKDNMKKRQRIG